MKYTSLFCAVAVAAAMSTSAFATVTTNDFNSANSVDFQDAAYTVGAIKEVAGIANLGWDVKSDDTSSIIAAPLSAFEEVEGYTGSNKLLKLNTEGQELKWTPTVAVTKAKSLIEMKVKLVASETAPAIDTSDTTIHAAVYLQADENNPTGDGLYAYTADGWARIAVSNEVSGVTTLAGLANGSTIALRVLMDYGGRKATYEAAMITDGVVGEYITLDTKDMSNGDSLTVQHLDSISFKGTGGVDDLFVKEIEETASTANITLQGFNGEDWYEIETGTVDTEDSNQAFTSIVTMQEGKVATVTVCDVNGTTLATLNNVLAANGALTVSCADYAGFEPDEDYLIRVLFSDPVTTFTVSFSTEYGTAPQAQTVQSGAYATNPGAPVYEGADYTFVEWQYQGVLYDFANTPVTGDITLVAAWQAASSGGDLPESFSIGDASQALPAGVKPIEIADGKFIVNVVEPTGAIASLIGADSLGGTFSDVNATRTEKNGYTELSYTMGNETAKFFKVKFTK